MKSKEEIKEWLLENATNKEGQIDISNIDFGDKEVTLEEIKAKRIFNNKQKAKEDIYNELQEAGENIFNDYQKAQDHISNSEQEADDMIDNEYQKAKKRIFNKGQEAEIILGNKKEWEVKE